MNCPHARSHIFDFDETPLDAAHCGDCAAMAAQEAALSALVDPPVPAGAWSRLRERRSTWRRFAAAAAILAAVATPLALWSRPVPRFDVVVVDVTDAPAAPLWLGELTMHAENDAVPVMPVPVDED